MDEFSEEERYAIWQRAHQALEATAGIKEQLQVRRERSWRGETGWPAPEEAPPAASARVRASARREGRNWAEEGRWVQDIATAIVDQRLVAFGKEICEAVGEAISQLLTEGSPRSARSSGKRSTRCARMRAEFKAGIAAGLEDVRTAVAGGSREVTDMLDRHIAKFDALIARWERLGEGALDRLADARSLPN